MKFVNKLEWAFIIFASCLVLYWTIQLVREMT